MIPYLTVRVGKIASVDRASGRCKVVYTDNGGSELAVQALAPQPLAVGESGIFIEPVVDAQVLVDIGVMNQAYIIAYLPENQFDQLLTLNNSLSINSSFLTRPQGQPGEITLKGFQNTYTKYLRSGDIETRFGTSKFNLDSSDVFSLYTGDKFISTQSGYSVSGTIRREIYSRTDSFFDKLTDPEFNATMSQIGRDYELPISLKSSPDPKVSSTKRNPPFVENRNVVFEFARDFSAGEPTYESQLYKNATDNIEPFSSLRGSSRADAFGLSPLQYNVLFESIVGTAVDIYGNILDINRMPIIKENSFISDNDVEGIYNILRKSVKVHVELNSRKAGGEIDFKSISGAYEGAENTIANHSRWFFDVDAEGQTKINIPASSSSGNIPVTSRYVPTEYFEFENKDDLAKYSSVLPDGSSDISLLNYSLVDGGVLIENSPESRNKAFFWNMVYHDFTFRDILDRETFFYPGSLLGEPLDISRVNTYANRLSGLNTQNSTPAEILSSTYISNTINANAGGRSLHANLDGSIELSIGKDQADGKSMCLDSSGSFIARFGKDLKGRSVVIGADGEVDIIIGASRTANNDDPIVGANLQFFVESSTGMASIQIIDGNIIVKSAPNKSLILESAGNMIINAGKDLFLGGERIHLFGKYTEDGETLAGEREITRSGNKVI